MTFILSLVSALLYGVADFSGGLATKRNRVFCVMLFTQAAGAIVALAASPLIGPNAPAFADLCWGAAAGALGFGGVASLYAGLAKHKAAIVSPLSALISAIIPACFGAMLGERPSSLALVGTALCLPAILFLAYEKDEAADRKELRASLLYGLVAGLGFGGFFVMISRTSAGSGIWPLLSARVATLVMVAAFLLVQKERFSVARRSVPIALFAGAADMLANVFFLLATRTGMLILVTIVTSLYPAPTVILARVFQGQKISPARAAGIALALAGVALIGLR
jgi:drug/metabolite transporter (DMT)-like permease